MLGACMFSLLCSVGHIDARETFAFNSLMQAIISLTTGCHPSKVRIASEYHGVFLWGYLWYEEAQAHGV